MNLLFGYNIKANCSGRTTKTLFKRVNDNQGLMQHGPGRGAAAPWILKNSAFSVIYFRPLEKFFCPLDCLINFIEKNIFNIMHNEIIMQIYLNIKFRRRKLFFINLIIHYFKLYFVVIFNI
jgi:hypothetical protein